MNSITILTNFVKVLKIVYNSYRGIIGPPRVTLNPYSDDIVATFRNINKLNNAYKTADQFYWRDKKFYYVCKFINHLYIKKLNKIIRFNYILNMAGNNINNIVSLISSNHINNDNNNDNIFNNNNINNNEISNKNISNTNNYIKNEKIIFNNNLINNNNKINNNNDINLDCFSDNNNNNINYNNKKFDELNKEIISEYKKNENYIFNNNMINNNNIFNSDTDLEIDEYSDNNDNNINNTNEMENEISDDERSNTTKDRRRLIYLLKTNNNDIVNDFIKEGENKKLENLIITKNIFTNDYYLYIKYKTKKDLFKSKYANYIIEDKSIRRKDQKYYIISKGELIYNKDFE